MYINVKFSAQSNKKNRWIPLNDSTTIREVEEIVNTLRCISDVEDVFVNVSDPNRKNENN